MNETNFTMDSKLLDIWKNPVGHDIISRLLFGLGLSQSLMKNPLAANLKLKQCAFFAGKKFTPSFWQSVLGLLNTDYGKPVNMEYADDEPERVWWKEAVVYQIYPRSFHDSNGDGIGDLRGIVEKLDYLKDLGVTTIWLSPIYDSPNDDNGYDIRDYEAIMEEFGTMADFLELLNEVHKRGMKLIMDLVINHSSDEHEWFQQALADPNSPYRNYYYFVPAKRKANGDIPALPNNWTSFFSGPAWSYYEEQEAYVLHLFSKKQMDLNWESPAFRQDVIQMIRRWLDQGVDGFRMDVVNFISKTPGWPDGDDGIGSMMGPRGIEHYFHGPRLHEHLRQLRKEAFEPYQAFTVGETPGVGLEVAKLMSSPQRKELDLVFSFDHLENPGKVRWDNYAYDLNYYKKLMIDWGLHFGDAWQSLFIENHDNIRVTSKIDPTNTYREEIAKLMAVIQLTLKGTPFIFQGQELGASNVPFTDISQLRDVESLNLYQELLDNGIPEEEIKAKVLNNSRDHSRVPMKWEKTAPDPFWIVGEGESPSVAEQEQDSDSVLSFYKTMISLRKKNPALVYGKLRFFDINRKNYFAYTRKSGDTLFFVECNLSPKPTRGKGKGKALLSTDGSESGMLGAYTARIFRYRK